MYFTKKFKLQNFIFNKKNIHLSGIFYLICDLNINWFKYKKNKCIY